MIYMTQTEFHRKILWDPLELNPDGTFKLESKKVDDAETVGLPVIKDPVEASIKQMLAPRLGISFPVTDRAKLHFTYGHYYQIPRGDDLYENLNFDMRGAIRRRGNPDLEPEKTIAYEVGIAQQFTDDLTADITGFTKDIDNLVSSVMLILPTITAILSMTSTDESKALN